MATENSRTQRGHTTPIYTPDFEVTSPPALPVHRNPLSTVEIADTHCQITSCHHTPKHHATPDSAHLWTLPGLTTTQNPYYFVGLPLRPIDHPGGLPIRVAESMAPGRSARRGSRIAGSPVRSDRYADPERMSGSAAGFPED
jgi:hypothetical protein